MEMHQVQYFLAVARTFNFTRAAEECNVTQPSLTLRGRAPISEQGRKLVRMQFDAPAALNCVHGGPKHDLIRKQLSKTVPFARHAGIEMEKVEKGRAVALLPFRPEGLNHIGTQHAGALFTVGEAPSGAAMASALAPILLEIRPVAAEAAIRFLAVAKGPVRAEAQVKGNADALVSAVTTDGKSVFQVVVNLAGEDGTKVAEMTVDWHVSMKRS
jgi:acyl-coenzyme A thioesterase PaaI-like protein